MISKIVNIEEPEFSPHTCFTAVGSRTRPTGTQLENIPLCTAYSLTAQHHVSITQKRYGHVLRMYQYSTRCASPVQSTPLRQVYKFLQAPGIPACTTYSVRTAVRSSVKHNQSTKKRSSWREVRILHAHTCPATTPGCFRRIAVWSKEG